MLTHLILEIISQTVRVKYGALYTMLLCGSANFPIIRFVHLAIPRYSIYPFKIIKINAGKETNKLSRDLILTIKPKNINRESPPDDNTRMGLKNRPTNNPMAPSICNITM